ncbi:MAG: RNA polymerase sigma factor [Desulfobulbaceae bacterium]|nr:RNA polymerase sigma factor [Candidatus Kapabacteria bacterium]MBS4000600.1 RNA polymerase sigma factor [Desulfobulbaceae bacterium]
MLKSLDEYSDTELFYMLCDDKKTAEKAFSEIFARHSSKVYAFCRRFLGNKEEAQDLFQETFIKFHQSASKDRAMTNLSAFLVTIARNLCVNYKRKDKPAISFEDYMAHSDDMTGDKNELLELVKSSLELLPDEYREIFILREYDGMSYNEIAKMINQPLNTVKVRIHRAKQKMREILQPYLAEMSKYE